MLIAGREIFALHVGPLARKHGVPYCGWIRGSSTEGALLGTLPIDEVQREFGEIARANLVVVPAGFSLIFNRARQQGFKTDGMQEMPAEAILLRE